ncbi:hypothetical protein B0F90DRAFT_583246 [Multifurca ochricompacta]|uniref:Uncharacterized protein n=1 Tax=Multifurca ochricompacta TaxID=376703 RepID=A0AAD4QN10_9AGAM|nr:hypothetical protein B0F90DRAFT_583246 [Multifurca ochricompacta]
MDVMDWIARWKGRWRIDIGCIQSKLILYLPITDAHLPFLLPFPFLSLASAYRKVCIYIFFFFRGLSAQFLSAERFLKNNNFLHTHTYIHTHIHTYIYITLIDCYVMASFIHSFIPTRFRHSLIMFFYFIIKKKKGKLDIRKKKKEYILYLYGFPSITLFIRRGAYKGRWCWYTRVVKKNYDVILTCLDPPPLL